jgi:ClpP class serine protease
MHTFYVCMVVKTLALELLRDYWIMHAGSVELYSRYAHDLLAGREISTGLFSSLQLPEVPPNIAMVSMVGPLMKSDVCNAKGSRSLMMEMQQAANDPTIDAIIFLSEACPGGQVSGTQELGDAVRMANAKKPVIGVVSDMACSAAVWALSPSQEIYSTSATAMVGCIGVVAQMRNPKKVDAENADIIEVYSDLSPDKNAEYRSVDMYKENILNPIAQLFHETVLAGRGDKLKLSKENVLSGKTYLAKQATEYGLIDGVMPFSKIIARANFLSKKRNQK